jgi:carbonic anhydrase
MSKQAAIRALTGFNQRAFKPHHPEIMCVTCIDGRERAGGNFAFEDEAVRVTEIAAIIPPYENAPANTRAKFSFTKMKNISVIKLTGHSYCGGAQIVTAYPHVDQAPNDEIRDIVQSIADSGADLPRLRDSFMAACEGNVSHAANLMSRHLVLVSLKNASGYPHVNAQIIADNLDMVAFYHMLKEGSGETSHLERYDVGRKVWVSLPEEVSTHMCDRPDNCASCITCHATIDSSLAWSPVEALVDEDIKIVEVPFHIARLLRERRENYQPGLHQQLQQRALECIPIGS